MLVKIHDGNVLGGPLWFTLSLLMCQPQSITCEMDSLHSYCSKVFKENSDLAESWFGFLTADERQGNNSVCFFSFFFVSLFPSHLLYLDEKNKKATLSFVSAILPEINLVLVRRGQEERRSNWMDVELIQRLSSVPYSKVGGDQNEHKNGNLQKFLSLFFLLFQSRSFGSKKLTTTLTRWRETSPL
jgi:hypothetical protein